MTEEQYIDYVNQYCMSLPSDIIKVIDIMKGETTTLQKLAHQEVMEFFHWLKNKGHL